MKNLLTNFYVPKSFQNGCPKKWKDLGTCTQIFPKWKDLDWKDLGPPTVQSSLDTVRMGKMSITKKAFL